METHSERELEDLREENQALQEEVTNLQQKLEEEKTRFQDI